MKTISFHAKPIYVIAIGAVLLFLVVSLAGNQSGSSTVQDVGEETVVVSAHSDPYFGLAQRISQSENLQLLEGFADVLQNHPKFVILVAAPENLTVEVLANMGNIYKSQGYYPAVGIISGSTLDAAEQLWERRKSVQAGNNFLGGDVDILQAVYEPTIFNVSDDVPIKIALTKPSLIETLQQADYFYWTRHSGGRTWYWNDGTEEDELASDEIPPLKPVVIYSPTCSIFRPWLDDSIALGFIDHGAAAFLGFTNSPHTTSFSKYGMFVPGLTSWNEIPLGLVAQVQNRAATKIIYRSPQLFMFGDPRIHLSKERPYQITSDRIAENGKRYLDGYSDTSGVLAVKIENGAEYRFLSIQGSTSMSENDVFYNSQVQSLDLGSDKYLLILHHGGSFQIELSPNIPVGWVFADALVDALDYSWVVLWVNVYADANPYMYLISLPIFAGIVLLKVFKQKHSLREYRKIFIFAFVFALFRLGYYLLRQGDYTVSANLLDIRVSDMFIGVAGVFSSAAGGLMVLKDSRKFASRIFGLLFAVSRQSWMAGFYFVFLTLLNNVPQVTKMTEAGVWNYTVFWLSLIPWIIEVTIFLAAWQFLPSDSA
jgi:hypothetical protein